MLVADILVTERWAGSPEWWCYPTPFEEWRRKETPIEGHSKSTSHLSLMVHLQTIYCSFYLTDCNIMALNLVDWKVQVEEFLK